MGLAKQDYWSPLPEHSSSSPGTQSWFEESSSRLHGRSSNPTQLSPTANTTVSSQTYLGTGSQRLSIASLHILQLIVSEDSRFSHGLPGETGKQWGGPL